MKKYNSFLGAFFSGDSGQGGYNAAYGKSALAKLYTSQDPAEQQMAAEGLARVDPESAGKWQQEQAALRQEGLKRKATMIANAPPAQRGQLYSAVLPDIRKDWAEAPEQYTPELDQMVTAWAQSVGGNSQNTGVQSTFISGGKLNYLTRDGRAVDTGKTVDDTYKEIIDPVTGQVSGYAKRGNYLAPAGTGGATPPPQDAGDPMNPVHERINYTAKAMKDAGVPVEQINAWADNAFAAAQKELSTNGVTVQGSAPPSQARVNVKPNESKGYTRVMTPQEVASAGLPQGTSAQVNEATGAISVLNKPLPTPQKQANADVVKQAAQLPSLLRRVDRVAQASEKLGLLGMDGGPIDQYALGLSEGGQELESAVGQLRSMLMPFVRVPGVGSQSDLEARLDGLQYPDASQPPAVRARNIAELQKFIADLSRVYSTVIKGEQGGGQAPVQVRNADDYNRLPPGTQYIDPTGKQRVKK